MDAPAAAPEVVLDESEQILLVNLAKRYFAGTLNKGMRRADSEELVQKMEKAIREKMAILERFMGSHGGFDVRWMVSGDSKEGAQRIIESLFATGELNFNPKLSDDDIKNIGIARQCLGLMIGDFHEANRKHHQVPVDENAEITGAAQRAVAEDGSFYFRGTDQVPFRNEVRHRLVKASGWA